MPLHSTLLSSSSTREHLVFSQKSLEALTVVYVHDDSDTINDGFVFRAWVAPSDKLSSTSPSSCSSLSPSSSLASSSSLSSSPLPESSPVSSSPFAGAQQRRSEDQVEVTERFSISVKPVNDQPPLIRTRAPGVRVVVGETVTLGPENLQVWLMSWYEGM